MIQRLLACALGLLCAGAVLLIVTSNSKAADFDKDWLFEDLTCEELVESYNNRVQILQQIIGAYNDCLSFADSPADTGHGALHCALIKKDGEFIAGMANDLADVFNARSCGKDK